MKIEVLLIILILLTLVYGEELKVTDNHPFLVNDSWVEASELNVGDYLTSIDGKKIKITSIQELKETSSVFNFETSFHDYVVNSIVVHNSNTFDLNKDTIELYYITERSQINPKSELIDRLGITCENRPQKVWGLRLKSEVNQDLVKILFSKPNQFFYDLGDKIISRAFSIIPGIEQSPYNPNKNVIYLLYPKYKIIIKLRPDPGMGKFDYQMHDFAFYWYTKYIDNSPKFFFRDDTPIPIYLVREAEIVNDKPLIRIGRDWSLSLEDQRAKKAEAVQILKETPQVWDYITKYFEIEEF